jgi:hypothetical protein
MARITMTGFAAVMMMGMLPASAGKPLKIYILAGQSNMQGKARVRTIERLKLTEDSQQMYQDMQVKDGLPSAVKDAYGVYFGGDDMSRGKARPISVQKGPLKPGFGDETTTDTNFGPEYTFAIYMQKHLNEPILIIKAAWGGRDLLQQFRPPSAGKYEKDKDRHGNPIGHYYNLIVKRVREVLADPGKYHPAYKKEDGYEIAGFVWFQGFNDMVGPYPAKDGKGPKDFSEYSRLMACFIRDVRKDLKAPKMPFVIGAIGIGGPIEDPKNSQYGLREAQVAPAALPEFKGNVAAVRTEKYWDMELKRIQDKLNQAAEKALKAENPKLGGRALQRAVSKKAKSMASEVLTPTEAKIIQTGTSNAAYHYMGSAYIYGNIGKAFAEAMIKMGKAE